ncbi:family 16 glycoside hydrolase [Granulicella paludicola]|uniref:family 16 glycoside hydrolase n=1 Tax=Granulicella paludicola TaxID=474951 RepID=UPI0021E073DD|nr:family 16 glycoside hydrolase [Granulicella paludicola]
MPSPQTWNEKTKTSRLFWGIAIGLLLLAAGYSWQSFKPEAVPTRLYPAGDGSLAAWTPYGGHWTSIDHVIYSTHERQDRGAKLVTGSERWTNYTLSTDMRFDGDFGDLGVVVRSRDEAVGLDAYNGYYVGVRMDGGGGSLMVGRSNYGWSEARPVPVPGGVHPGAWLRLTVVAYGCDIAASVQNMSTLQTAWIAFHERSCLKSGRIGLRSVDNNGVWRNISLRSASREDYLALEQHAGSIEQPVVLNGPPWWTPWHVGMLFVGVLATALLIQFAYFRAARWKSDTIIQERERMAHEIHDTMAQSFAGVGYQIQGIRSSVVRGDQLDRQHIADQLAVAYQLIRRCHQEASGTIAMLGLSSASEQRGLLETLRETADRIGGDKIKTHTALEGHATTISLSLADALLHIGQEAIANAVGHGNPSMLTIKLRYEEDAVELSVSDDGQGFEMSPHTTGLGIMGMQKRARNVAAVLEILSVPGEGTEIRVRAECRIQRLPARILSWLRELLWNGRGSV